MKTRINWVKVINFTIEVVKLGLSYFLGTQIGI